MRLLKIGRDVTCDIVINSPKVSALHAELTVLDSGDYIIEDKGSHNGTYVLGNRIIVGNSVKVNRGDSIQFGDVNLNWSQIPMPEDNSAYSAIFSIGSHMNNRINVPGSTVSRYHAAIKIFRNKKKAVIVDYSKNGTMVDGVKIPSNNPVEVWRESNIVCGGVPVPIRNIKEIPSRKFRFKKLIYSVAAISIMAFMVWGIYNYFCSEGTMSDAEIHAKYAKTTVMLVGVYHYEVSCGDMSKDDMQKLNIPLKILPIGSRYMRIDNAKSSELVDLFVNPEDGMKGQSQATGFFVSQDGKIITNLHVVKPWLFDESCETLKNLIASEFSAKVQNSNFALNTLGRGANGLGAYVSQIRVIGKLDYVALIPQGQIFDKENIRKCKVLSAGEDIKKDVALIQTVSMQLPNSECRFIDLSNTIDINDKSARTGTHVYTIGFPAGTNLQDESNEQGIQAFGNGGNITLDNQEYVFGFNAPSYHGASGSAVFNENGKLVGVLNGGVDTVQGFNYAVKIKYVKELLETTHMH